MDLLRRIAPSPPAGERVGERGRPLLFLLLLSCAATGPLTKSEATTFGTRTWTAPTDEVFDATWLTLVAHGYAVTSDDRVAGTLVFQKGERLWDVDVAALGTEQRVVLSPRHDTTRTELAELLDALELGTRTLLGAWTELPEWKYDGRRNLLRVPRFAFAPPPEWEWLDFDISRRLVVVQQHRARTGLNPTLLVELDRRRPRSPLTASLRRAAGLTLGARERLSLPDELDSTKDDTGLHGALRVLDGTTPKEVSWHARESVLGPVDVRLIMVCPKAAEVACQGVWASVIRSVQQGP